MTVHHIVLVRYKEGVTEEGKKAWRDEAAAITTKIPQIKELAVGNKVPHRFDQGWDDAVVIQFATVADLRQYVAHQAHQDFQKFGGQYSKEILVFDFETY